MTTSQIGIKLSLDGAASVTSGLAGVQNSLGSLAGRVETVRSALSGFAPALASAFTVGGLVAFVRNTTNAIDAMNDLADAAGASIEEISKLDQVARRNGASLDAVGSMLVKFNAQLKEADGKNGASLALQAIGLEATKLRQLDPAEALRQTAVALAGFANDANKARLTQELFGKSVREAAPFLNDLAEAGQLNASVTAQQAAEAEKFNKQLFAFQANASDAARAIVSDLLPSLTQLIQQLNDGAKAYKSFWDATLDIGLNVDPFKSLNANLANTVKEIGTYRDIVNELQNRSGPDLFGRRAAEVQKYQKSLEIAIAREQYLLQQLARAGGGRGTAAPGATDPAKPALLDIAAEQARRKAAEDSAAALLKQEEAYDKLRVSIEERISAGQLELTQGQALTEAQRLKIKLDQDYASGLLKLTPAQKAVLDGKVADLAATEGQVKAEQESLKAAKAAAEARADARRAEDRAIAEFQAAESARASASLASVKDRITSLQAEAKATDLAAQLNISLAEALELVTIARMEEERAKYIEGSDEYLKVQREIDARKELANLIGSSAAREANRRAADDAAREWQRTADQIGQSLTDALMQGGKSAWEYIKGLFRTMVLRPVIQAIVNPIAGAFTGSMGGPGALGTLGGINSLATLGNTLTGSVAGSIGNVIGTAGTLFGSSALTSFAAGMKGATLAPGLMGPTTAGATGAMGAGASVAAAIPYVAAALAVANALGVFRSKSIVGGGLTGTLGAGDIQSYDLQRRGGTLFSGPDYSMVNRQTSTESAAIQSAFEALRTNAASMAEALGLSSAAVKSFTTVLGTDITQNDIGTRGIKLDGLTPEQAAKKVEEALAAANEELAAFVLGASRTVTESITTTVEDWAEGENDRYLRGYLDQVSEVTRTIEATGPSFARTGETAVQTLTRLASSISTINPVLDLLGLQLFDTSLAGADLASTMADAFGGLEAFTAATSTYYQEFFSEAERTAAVTAQLTETLGGLGLALPATRAAFRALVEAQDLSTESGRKAASTLIQLSGAFASITQEVSTLANSFARDAVQSVAASLRSMRSDVAEANLRVLQARQNVFDSYSSSLERLRGLLRQSAASTAAFGQSIQELLNDLRFSADLSPYSPTERFAVLQQTYGSTLSAARGGDAAAMEQLPDIARQFVAAAQDLSQTEVEYATYVAGIQQDLATVMADATARQAALMAQMPSAAVAPDATLAQEIAAAVADLRALSAAVATTGGMASLANNQTATAIEAFNAAVEQQTAATGSLNAALAALSSLGLSQSAIDALSAGISSGASAYADALGVSEDTISQLQDALGINDEALDAAAAALKVQLEAETVTRLATALGLPEATVRELATSLGVDAQTLEKISTALGLSSQQAAELNTILGLSPAERIRLANALGINSAATTALATAVGVSPAALSALQASLGLSQASTATIAGLSSIIDFSPAALAQINRLAAIRLQIDEDIVQQLATSLGLPAETVRQLATALGVSVGTLGYLSTALGLSSQQAAELQTILGLSATERASLANALGINSAATTALATAVGVSPAALSALQAAVGLSQASAATIASLPSIIDFSPAALAQINRLAGALGLQPAVLQSLAQAVALKPEVLPALAASLGLSDAQLSDLALSLGYSATTADALAESLGLGAGLTQELSQALGLSPAAIETIRVLSGALSGIPSTIRVESAPASLVTPGVRSSIRDIAGSGTQDEKAALYRMLRLIGLDDAVIRSTVDAEVGPQTDDAWALLKRVAGFAAGGMHQGGWRVVGEAGPELAYTGPERIFSNAQSRSLMDTSRLEAQMAALQAELALLRAETRATAVNTAKTADLIERATDGGSDYVRVVVDETIS